MKKSKPLIVRTYSGWLTLRLGKLLAEEVHHKTHKLLSKGRFAPRYAFRRIFENPGTELLSGWKHSTRFSEWSPLDTGISLTIGCQEFTGCNYKALRKWALENK